MNTDSTQSGFVAADAIRSLSPREASGCCAEGAIILDVREEYINQFKGFSAPVVIQIPLRQLESEYSRLPKDKLIIVADSSGLHSKEAIALLKGKGFTQLANLAGGFVEWERDGMPCVRDKSQQLSGSCACQLRAREKGNTEQP